MRAPRRTVARAAAADVALPRVRVRRRNEKPAIPDDADLFGPSRTAATFDDHILQIDIIGTDALRPDRYVCPSAAAAAAAAAVSADRFVAVDAGECFTLA